MFIMKRLMIALLLLSQTIHAAEHLLHVRYAISYAIFGTIGFTEATLKIDPVKQRYTIDIEARARGLAKVMSNGRIEHYQSRGVVHEGMLRPQVFTTVTQKGVRFEERHRYRFDHGSQKITHMHRLKNGEDLKVTEELLPYYAKDDILTLFFNLKKYVTQGVCRKSRCTLTAVGANDKDGRIDIFPAKGEMLRVLLHRRIFASKQGELYVHLTKEGFSDYALLKDVIFFGDVKAKAIKIARK